MLKHICSSRLVDFSEVLISGHNGFLIDADLEQYFGMKVSTCNRLEIRKLNLTNRKHRVQFQEKVEGYVEKMNLVERAERTCNHVATAEELNKIDDTIAYVLSASRKFVKDCK